MILQKELDEKEEQWQRQNILKEKQGKRDQKTAGVAD